MLKPLSFSVSLTIALGAASLSYAGGHHKALPSAQGEWPSAQSVIPSAQSISEGCGEATCGPVKKKCDFFSKFKPHHEYTYEWVLKKKKVHKPLFGHKSAGCSTGTCGAPACDSCGTAMPSSQSYPAPQSYGSGQSWGTTQIPATYSVPQAGGLMSAPAGMMAPAGAEAPPAPVMDAPAAAPAPAPAPAAAPAAAPAPAPAPAPPAVPPAPAPPTASTGGLQLLPSGY